MGHANLIELDGGPSADRAARIAAGAERGDAMTRRLLSFGAAQPTQLIPVDVASVVAELVRTREAATGLEIRYRVHTEPDLPAAHADKDRLAEALENVLLNAEQAIGAALIQVDIGLAMVPPSPASASPTLQGECVRIRVHDDGEGFTHEARAHLFEPFWTSRAGGHGIGLAAARSLLASVSGGVDVPSGVEGGVVDLLLPISTHTPEASAPARPALPRGQERIWVVDDEAELVELLTASLGMLGYQTRGFLRGAEVVAALDAGERPDLFTLDVRMPDMDGPSLHAALRQRGVRAPVLFCSGMVGVPLPSDDRVSLLEKPFKLSELAAEVRRLIDRWVLLRQSAQGPRDD
jgi:two-component system, cell cycle sensor histidine kinase and response regulator CckA